jgi:hypothetical protein
MAESVERQRYLELLGKQQDAVYGDGPRLTQAEKQEFQRLHVIMHPGLITR